METYRFGDLIEKLILHLEDMAANLMLNHMNDYGMQIPELYRLIGLTFPTIVESYSGAELKAVADDALYWSSQLDRILGAIDGKDKFVKLDVLYQETRTNLIGYYEMIRNTKIADQTIAAEEEGDVV